MAWLDLAEDLAELFSDARLERKDGYRRFRLRNPAEAVETTRRWRALNRARHNATVRARYARQAEERCNYLRTLRAANLEAHRARDRKWYAANKDAINQKRRERRARKRVNPG